MNDYPFPFGPLNQDPKKELEEILKWQEKINQENIKALRKVFKDEIKETFMINMLNKVKKDHNDFLKYYPNALTLNPIEMYQGSDDRIDFDICCHIVGTHKFNTLFLDESKKGVLQKDTNYKNKFMNI